MVGIQKKYIDPKSDKNYQDCKSLQNIFKMVSQSRQMKGIGAGARG